MFAPIRASSTSPHPCSSYGIPSEVISLIYDVSITNCLPYDKCRRCPFVYTSPTTILQFTNDDCSISITEVDLHIDSNDDFSDDDDIIDDISIMNTSSASASASAVRGSVRKVYLPISTTSSSSSSMSSPSALSTTSSSTLPTILSSLSTFCIPSFPLQILQVSHHHDTNTNIPRHEFAVQTLIDDLGLGLATLDTTQQDNNNNNTPRYNNNNNNKNSNNNNKPPTSSSSPASTPLTVVHVKSPTTHDHHLLLLTPTTHKTISLPHPANGYAVSPTHLTVWDEEVRVASSGN